MADYDDVAASYDATRGGERRGDEIASYLDRHLRRGLPVVELGVGTGVVALGLRRRGHTVVGLDLSTAMLGRARSRLGSTVVCGDLRRSPFRSDRVHQLVAIWVTHAIEPPEALFAEAARLVVPGGTFLVCPTNRPADGEVIEPILGELLARAERLHPGFRHVHVTAGDVLSWAGAAGFSGAVETHACRPWRTTAAEEVAVIEARVWPALRGLGEQAFREVVAPTIAALEARPSGEIEHHLQQDVVVLARR